MGTYHYLYNKEKKTVYELGQNVCGFLIVDDLNRGLCLEEILKKINDEILPRRWTEKDIKELSDNIKNTIGTDSLSSYNDLMDPPENCSQYVLVGTRYDQRHIGKYLWGSEGWEYAT